MTYTLIPGKPYAASEEETISMIRAVLTDEVGPELDKKSDLRVVSQNVTPSEHDVPQIRARDAAPTRRDAFVELRDTDSEPSPTQTSRRNWNVLRNVARSPFMLTAFRPTIRHLAIVSTLLLVVVRPYWVLFGIVLGVASVVAAFLFLGEGRIWNLFLKRLHRIEAKDPDRALELRTSLDNFAYRWDSILDLFSEGMLDWLCMPDFQSMGYAEERHMAAMSERLARLGQEG